MGDMVEIIARAVPANILAALTADAEARDVTRQEAAVGILASTFDIHRTPSGRRFIPGEASPTLILSVPDILRDKIRTAAFRTKGTMRGVMCSVLAQHYSLPEVPTGRRPKGEAA